MSILSTFIGIFIALIVVLVIRATATFGAQRPNDYAGEKPTFDIRKHLDGRMICEGIIYGPTGRVASRFIAEINAKWTGDEGHMTEHFQYDTGTIQDRAWTLKIGNDGTFSATAPDIIGTGHGQHSGASVKMAYTIQLPKTAGGYILDVTDWMYLLQNGSIMNRSQLRKYGIKVGELIATIRKAD